MFAQVGEQIGRATMVEYMKRFGFYQDPELDYPDFQMIPSGIINGEGDFVTDGFDVGRVAIGQGGLEGEIRASPGVPRPHDDQVELAPGKKVSHDFRFK